MRPLPVAIKPLTVTGLSDGAAPCFACCDSTYLLMNISQPFQNQAMHKQGAAPSESPWLDFGTAD
jgi:hypothetical protein